MDIERNTANPSPLFSVKSEADPKSVPPLGEDRNTAIQVAYRRALPAIARVVNVNTEALRAKLFDTLSDVAHTRDVAIAEVERMCEEVRGLLQPHHIMPNALSPGRALNELLGAVRLHSPAVPREVRGLPKAMAAAPAPAQPAPEPVVEPEKPKPKPKAKRKTLKGMGKGFFQHSDAKVRKARKMIKANKMTKREIAAELGMSDAYVYGIASGKVRPDVQ
jgi:hypothetical protein